MNTVSAWYIVKQTSGICQIIQTDEAPIADKNQDSIEQWGPYPSQNEAIARRVGLIRVGKCKPV